MLSKSFVEEIISFIENTETIDKITLNKEKKRLCKKYSVEKIPLDSEIYALCPENLKKKLKKILRVKQTRANAGVNVIAVMTPPMACPHGRCIFCPGGPTENTPQSYTGLEPAAMRGKQNNYDSYKQTLNRMSQLKNVGHDLSKLEVIIMGGTFPSYPYNFQENFIKGIFDAVAEFSNEKKAESFDKARLLMEKTKHRIVGLTFETRPDQASEKQIRDMLYLGGTRVELGVQNLDSKILIKNGRAHTIKEVIEASQRLKDSSFKLLYHIMPGMYGSNMKKDLQQFKKIFSENFAPDMIKVYPCLVIKGTVLYKLWEKGLYKPYSNEEFEEFMTEAYKYVPYWVRIMRIQRDIPATKIEAGPKRSNFREIVLKKAKNNKLKEIRSREFGQKKITENKKIKYFIEKYKANKGTEYFISAETEDRDVLFGFARLRFPYKPFIDTIKDSALLRELHVYGPMVPIGEKNTMQYGQHKGIGKKLMSIAESIAKEKYDKISVIAGLGVREYYYKIGYKRDEPYVSKKI